MRILAIVAAALALVAPAALAKEGAQAHLLAPLPSHPRPGALMTIRWTVDVPGAKGRRVPFGAIGMFVRLVGRNGASTVATARQMEGPPYSVRIRVPGGGIRAIRFGLHGSTDIYFPLK
jgi:hypothetical protein